MLTGSSLSTSRNGWVSCAGSQCRTVAESSRARCHVNAKRPLGAAAPWQRPTNENTNGLVREYYPKGTRFDSSVSDSDVQAMQDQLNRRPRKVLEYATPAEVLGDMLLAGVP